MRITRAAKKRTAAAMEASESLQLPPNKKRVVLGELSGSSNVAATPASVLGSGEGKQKFRGRKKAKAVVAVPDINAKLDDPQMCVPYASDIYEYLHKMEVSGVYCFFDLDNWILCGCNVFVPRKRSSNSQHFLMSGLIY